MFRWRKYLVETHFQWKHANRKMYRWIENMRSRSFIEMFRALCKQARFLDAIFSITLVLSSKT
jgi:hypothetical protein